MLTETRVFNPMVEVFNPYTMPFAEKLEAKGSNNQNSDVSAAMPCTACSACGVCSACSACSACWG